MANRYVNEKGELLLRSTLLTSVFRGHRELDNKAKWLLAGGNEDTDAIMLGELAHCLLFESDKVEERFTFYEGNRTTKSYKMAASNKNARPVSSKLLETAQAMVQVVKDYAVNDAPEKVRKLLFGGLDDQYHHEKELLLRRGTRWDVIRPDAFCSTHFLDYKTTSLKAVDAAGWRERMMEYRTHIQLGFYYKVLCDLKEIDGDRTPIEGAYHLVQSTVAPYTISLFFFPRASLENTLEDVQVATDGLLSLWEERSKPQRINLSSVLNFGGKEIDQELSLFLEAEGRLSQNDLEVVEESLSF